MPTTTTLIPPFTPHKLRVFVQSTVREELRTLLDDPDFGCELRPAIVRRLATKTRSGKNGPLLSARDVIDRLGLEV